MIFTQNYSKLTPIGAERTPISLTQTLPITVEQLLEKQSMLGNDIYIQFTIYVCNIECKSEEEWMKYRTQFSQVEHKVFKEE